MVSQKQTRRILKPSSRNGTYGPASTPTIPTITNVGADIKAQLKSLCRVSETNKTNGNKQ